MLVSTPAAWNPTGSESEIIQVLTGNTSNDAVHPAYRGIHQHPTETCDDTKSHSRNYVIGSLVYGWTHFDAKLPPSAYPIRPGGHPLLDSFAEPPFEPFSYVKPGHQQIIVW